MEEAMVGTVHSRFCEKTLDELTERLIRRRDAIAHCLESLQLELSDAAAHRDCSDLLDESSVDDADLGTDRLLLAQAQRAYANVQRALERLEDGTYGICAACGANIPITRLRALPDTRLCVTCSRAIRKHAPEHEDWDRGWTALV
jgi:DnaK suppressor protein